MRKIYLSVFAAILMVGAIGCLWGQSHVDGLPASIMQEIKNPNMLPDGRYSLQAAWEAEGKLFSHSTGHVAADPQSGGGKAWTAQVDADSAGHIVYGPYLELPPGDYVAFFRIKLLAEAGTDEDISVVDAATSGGGAQLQMYSLTGGDLTYGKYVQAPLAFRYGGGKLETRMLWSGIVSMALDNVTVYRLEGGNPASVVQQIPRVPQVQPTGKPNDLIYAPAKRPFPDIFPVSSRPAEILDYMNISNLSPDWQLLLQSLQGIVNRDKPVVYLKTCPQDGFWLDWIRKRGWIKGTRKFSDPRALIAKYRKRLNGVVVTDPMLASSKNIATMIAGVENVIAASPRLAKQLGLPVKIDLRGKWQDDAQAYRWAFDNLWDRMNHHVAACLWPHANGVRDYLVQHKVFIFWIPGPIDGAKKSSAPEGQMRFVEELLGRLPANIPIMGYSFAGVDVGIGEGGGVGLMAEFGKYLVGSISTANISVHSGFRVPAFRQPDHGPVPPLRKDRIYISLLISDGDNLGVMSIGNWPQVWKNNLRGKFPVAWTISPASGILIPDIMDYYYTTATRNDTFMAAVSGVGYTYPTMYGKRFRASDQQAVFDGFLDQSRIYMRRMELDTINPSNVSGKEIRRFAEKLPELKAIFPDYGRVVSSYDEATQMTARSVPVFHAVTGGDPKGTGEQQIENLVAQITDIAPKQRPAFMHVFICNWFWDLPAIKKAIDRLGPDYVVVAPDHLAALCKQDMEARQVVMRVQPVTIGLEGEPVTITVPVQNLTSKPMKISVRLTGGLSEHTVSPDASILAPGAEVNVVIKGVPSAGRASLEIRGPFGTRVADTEIRLVRKSELSLPLPKGTTLHLIRQFEAESMPHNTGRKVADAGADAGFVWSAYKRESQPGHLAYGPYVGMEPGRYLAIFRMKRLGEGDGTITTLDSAVGGRSIQTSVLQVTSEMLPIGEFREVPLVFDHPGGLLETRALWTGNASLALDSISLWEVK